MDWDGETVCGNGSQWLAPFWSRIPQRMSPSFGLVLPIISYKCIQQMSCIWRLFTIRNIFSIKAWCRPNCWAPSFYRYNVYPIGFRNSWMNNLLVTKLPIMSWRFEVMRVSWRAPTIRKALATWWIGSLAVRLLGKRSVALHQHTDLPSHQKCGHLMPTPCILPSSRRKPVLC